MELLTSAEIVSLSPPERLALIPLSQAQATELERRLATLEQDRRHSVTWAALKAELEQRCP